MREIKSQLKSLLLTTGGDVLRRPYRDVTQGQCDWSYISFNLSFKRYRIQTDVLCCCGRPADGFTLWHSLLHSNPRIGCLQALFVFLHNCFVSTLPSPPALFCCYIIQLIVIPLLPILLSSLPLQCYQKHRKMSSLMINWYLLYFLFYLFCTDGFLWTFIYCAALVSTFAILVLPTSNRCK